MGGFGVGKPGESLEASHADRPGRKRFGAVLFAAILALLASGPARAGAWLQEKGTGQSIIGGSFTGGTAAFDENGNLVPIPDYRKFELTYYLEYGIASWLTGVLKADARTETSDGLIDASTAGAAVGARIKLWQAPNWVLSGQLLGQTGDYDTVGLQVGETEPGVESRLLFGYGFSVRGLPSYADTQVAYVFRTGGDVDEVKVDFTIGMKPWPKWELALQTFSTFSVGSTATVPEFNYHKVKASVLRQLGNRTAIQVSGQTLLFGENAVREYTGEVAFWRTF